MSTTSQQSGTYSLSMTTVQSNTTINSSSLPEHKNLLNVTVTRESIGFGTLLKYTSLVVLVVQNASQVLTIRYARTRDKPEMFFSTTAVFCSEITKLCACMIIVSWNERSPLRCLSQMYRCIVGNPMDTAKVCVPSVIYTIQNNLLYIAVSHLSAATFMVTYQLKILTTALCSVIMLRKPLSRLQWLSLVLLFVGVSIVQLQEKQSQSVGKRPVVVNTPNDNQSVTTANHSVTHQYQKLSGMPEQSPMIGLTAVVVACFLSAFSGIYFEKILKGSDISVWMRNIQLAILSIPVSFVMMQAKDGAALRVKGILYGYDRVVWTIVLLYALGGLTVAVVIKYADNILKGFATSVSIIVSCVVSVYLFNFQPTPAFAGGTALVMLSVYIYSKYPYVSRTIHT